VYPTQATEIFGSVSTLMFLHHLVPWPSVDIQVKCYGDRSGGTSPTRALNASDFGRLK